MSMVKQYVTKQSFGGQRASMKRAVLCNPLGSILLPGEIVAVDEATDLPVIQVGDGSGYRGTGLRFFECKTVEDLDNMPAYSWTWPPRV